MAGGDKRRGRPPATEPSDTQQQILDFIRGYGERHGYPPSIPEIASGVGRVYSSVREQLDRLERMGFITRQANVARSLTLTDKAGGTFEHRPRHAATGP